MPSEVALISSLGDFWFLYIEKIITLAIKFLVLFRPIYDNPYNKEYGLDTETYTTKMGG